MSVYRVTPRARADLDRIWDYTIERWGNDQAERYLRLVAGVFELIAADPGRGTRCEELRPGYRRVAAGAHIVFFRQTGEAIEIVRILHQRMDFDSHL